MKIVQSFWSKPSSKKIAGSRGTGGWLEKKHHYMSWALSCLQLRSFYDDVTLVTDEAGKKLFIDLLDLPYTNVVVELDCLNGYHFDLWSLAKLHTYRLQQEPFLHVDGDFFAFKKFSNEIENAALVSQNELTIDERSFSVLFKQITDNFPYLPDYVVENYPKAESVTLYNAGILGGQDFSFFNTYSAECFKFVDQNINIINPHVEFAERDSSTNFGIGFIELFNTIIESYLFTSLAKTHLLPVTCLLDESILSTYDYKNLMGNCGYGHPVYYYKKNSLVCIQVEYYLKKNFPHHYYKILSLLDKYYI